MPLTLGQPLHRLNTVAGRRMGGEKSAGAGAFGLFEPRERIGHELLAVMAGAAEDFNGVRVRLAFIAAAVVALQQRAA